MNLKVKALSALDDNYIWMLIQGKEAVCVDPGQSDQVIQFLQENDLSLHAIWITHHHGDHTAGVQALKQAYPECRVYGHVEILHADESVKDGNAFIWGACRIEVLHLPGHTLNHMGYVVQCENQIHAFVGDTLFSAGCGRVFPESKAAYLYESLQRLNQLPENTLLYPAHEYTAANLRFAAHIEPNNIAVKNAAQNLQTPSLPVRLADERLINPFLRTHLKQIAQNVEILIGHACEDECAVFCAMRELKNRF